MTTSFEAVLFLLASTFAASAGFFGGCSLFAHLRKNRHKQLLRLQGKKPNEYFGASKEAGALEARVVGELILATRRLESGGARQTISAHLGSSEWLEKSLPTSGLAGSISSAGFWETRLKYLIAGSVAGLLAGLCLSSQLALLLAAAGAFGGWQLPKWAMASLIRSRAEHMERHLAEMLDVMALGLRGGLSFERSLTLYLQHFDTALARSFELAHRQWSCGFATREEALRQVAASYDSPVMTRVIEDMVRSLRFGASLAESLEMAAREVRASYRSRKEEQVAKAPVKMLVPTGALILPAMLILVLGPVLLELMEGF